MRARFTARAAVGAALCSALCALAPAQEVVELPWRETADGRLEYRTHIPGEGVGEPEWQPMFPDLVTEDSAFGTVADLPVVTLVPLLCHGVGGAGAIVEAEYRLERLPVRLVRSHGWIRAHLEPHPLRDLLAVRWLAASETAVATFALREMAALYGVNEAHGERERDAFVRAAAAAALIRRSPELLGGLDLVDDARALIRRLVGARAGAGSLHAGLARLPDDAKLVGGFHAAAVPDAAPMLQAWRQLVARHASEQMLDQEFLSPAQLRIAQLAADSPGQLPYELASRFGNWRADYALFARRGADAARWWWFVGGKFQPDRVQKGLETSGLRDVTSKTGVVAASSAGWRVRVSSATFELWQGDLDDVPRGARVAELHDRATEGAAPVWLWIEPDCPGVPLTTGAAQPLDVRVDPVAGVVRANATFTNEAAAAAVSELWSNWQAGARFDLDERADIDAPYTWRQVEEAPPGLGEIGKGRLTWRRCVTAVKHECDGVKLTWNLDLAAFPLVDRLRWLAPPLVDRLRYR